MREPALCVREVQRACMGLDARGEGVHVVLCHRLGVCDYVVRDHRDYPG